jgi:glycosyltransferase involved in cell wall biosynthesis
MLLSIYTAVRNGLYYDFHIVDMLKHHLPLADEIVVHEGYSDDGTYEAIANIDPKIRIVRSQWQKPGNSIDWYVAIKDRARRECRGQWCLLVDADEFIPEWEFDRILNFIKSFEGDIAPFRILDFYGNYKVSAHNPHCWRKMILHRNRPDIENWGDGANVRIIGNPFKWEEQELRFTLHHFGSVRAAERLREKWHIQGHLYGKRNGMKVPAFVFDWFPHDWKDPDIIARAEIYDGPYVRAVLANPAEFVRDDFQLYDYLRAQAGATRELHGR